MPRSCQDFLEVRCCCVPVKLLGWLPLPRPVCNGDEIIFPLQPEPVKTWGDWLPDTVIVERVKLPVKTIGFNDGRRYLAFSSEETPLEKLRRIRGFRENKSGA